MAEYKIKYLQFIKMINPATFIISLFQYLCSKITAVGLVASSHNQSKV